MVSARLEGFETCLKCDGVLIEEILMMSIQSDMHIRIWMIYEFAILEQNNKGDI